MLSGAAGLILQLLWTLRVSTFYGVSAHAIATILAAFMGGLSLGAWLGERLLAGRRQALVLYAGSELVVAVSALAVQAAFDHGGGGDHTGGLAVWFASVLPGPGPVATAARWALLTGVLLVPTAAMGASFPFLVRGLVRGPAPRWISAAYGVNVLGAAGGCWLAANVLLPELGIARSVWLAAGLNLSAAGIALGVSIRRWGAVPAGPSSPVEAPPRSLLLLVCFAGGAAMAFEVLWSRMYRQAMWLANPFQAFAEVLGLILGGMALGAVLLSLRPLEPARARRAFGWIQWGMAAICALGITSARWMAAELWGAPGAFRLLSSAMVTGGAVLLGMGFPLLAASHERAERAIGGLYAISALGGVAGTIFGGFFLIPLLGTRLGLLTLAAGFIATGAAALWPLGRPRVVLGGAAVGGALVIALGAVTEDRLEFECHGCRVLWLKDGLEATTAVVETPNGHPTLYTDGRSITPGALPQRALTPFLIAPKTDRALAIGFGSGQLAQLIVQNLPEVQLDCVELDGNMARATGFFGTTDIFDEPNFRLFADDGRQHLLRNRDTYDLVIADTFTHAINPQIYGSGFFAVARDALTEEGSFFITVPLQDLPSDVEAQIILRTAAMSFPHAYVIAPQGLLAILGRKQPLDTAARIGRLPDTLQRRIHFRLQWRDIYRIDEAILAGFETDRINTDDRPYFFPLMRASPPGLGERMRRRIRGWGGLPNPTSR